MRLTTLLLLLSLVLAACGGTTAGWTVEDARYRLASDELGAGYMEITNIGDETITLTGASSEIAGVIELHETTMDEEGQMAMQPRPEGFTIAPGETLTLEEGGKHLMLMEVTGGGDDATITLEFGDETLEVEAVFDAESSASHGDSEHDG